METGFKRTEKVDKKPKRSRKEDKINKKKSQKFWG